MSNKIGDFMICKFLKKLFGFDKEKKGEVKWLEDKLEENKKKLKEIENEDYDKNNIVDHFNE